MSVYEVIFALATSMNANDLFAALPMTEGLSDKDLLTASREMLLLLQQASLKRIRTHEALLKLTPREREVAGLLQLGAGVTEIADQMGCTTRTVRAHIEHMRKKLQVTNIVTLLAVINGLLVNLPIDRSKTTSLNYPHQNN